MSTNFPCSIRGPRNETCDQPQGHRRAGVPCSWEPDPLTFCGFALANRRRCEESYFALDHWTETDWACALAGEVGEFCNLVKKLRRGDPVEVADLARELADVVTYADLAAQRLGIDLGGAVRAKFNEVSTRIGSAVRLDPREGAPEAQEQRA